MKKIYINLILLSNILLANMIIQNSILSMEKDIIKSTADNYRTPNILEDVPSELLSIIIINVIESYVNDWDGITDWQIIKKNIAQDLVSKRLISKEISKRLSEINDYEYIEYLISQIDERLQNKIKTAIENRREKTAKLIEILDDHITNDLNMTVQDWQEIINLIHTGADVNAKSQESICQETLLDLAINQNNKDMIKLLIDEGARYDENSLASAVREGDIDIVELFMKDKNVDDINNLNLINIASRYGYKNIVKLLIDKGANVNIISSNYNNTALMQAATYGYKDIVELLIDNGASIDIQDYIGITALIKAALHYKDIVELLINKGADINIKDNYGKTALMYALEVGNTDIAKLLIDSGANINIKDNMGFTALIYATNRNKKDMVELLIIKGVNIDNYNGNIILNWAKQRNYNDIVKLIEDRIS